VLPQIESSVLEGTYVPETFDYEAELPDGTPGRMAWTEIFRRAIPQFRKRAAIQLLEDAVSDLDERSAEDRAQSFASEYADVLDKMERDPNQVLPGYEVECSRSGLKKGLSCKVLCTIRETCLARIGLRDAFKHVKRKENAESLLVLPSVIRDIDTRETAGERMELALRGCFAGNLFDLGAHFSSERYEKQQEETQGMKNTATGGLDYHYQNFQKTRENLPKRPWLVDSLDQAVDQLSTKGKFTKAVVFADNAGSDLILGILPFCRELLRNGTSVVLAANEKPTINDITQEELLSLFTRVSTSPRVEDQVLCSAAESGQLSVVSTGSDLPIIDLSQVSAGIVEAARDADLVVLQGMGRAIESNLNAKFATAVLKMGVVKHPEVALCLRGNLGDPICKFQPVP
jgi:type II pantothenate kinase